MSQTPKPGNMFQFGSHISVWTIYVRHNFRIKVHFGRLEFAHKPHYLLKSNQAVISIGVFNAGKVQNHSHQYDVSGRERKNAQQELLERLLAFRMEPNFSESNSKQILQEFNWFFVCSCFDRSGCHFDKKKIEFLLISFLLTNRINRSI